MHPLKIYLDGVRARCRTTTEYRQKVKQLASTIGVAPVILAHIQNPNQNRKIAIAKALRLELATNGAVPAESVCGAASELIGLATMVADQRRGGRSARSEAA